jgi:hypothetical protein
MYKKQLHHLWRRIRPIKTWYLFAAFLLCATVCAFTLRNNNLTMVSLRNQVYQADKDNADVEGALQKLRSYVNAHMNTNLSSGNESVYPPIQLKYTYERLQQAEQSKVTGSNDQVYSDAQHYCEQLYPGSFSGGPRVPCIEKYVTEHGSSAKAKDIPASLYKFDFVSPRWSPDLAGWTMALSILLLALTVLRFLLGRLLRALTR